jgi:hypothetical protein
VLYVKSDECENYLILVDNRGYSIESSVSLFPVLFFGLLESIDQKRMIGSR